MSHIYPWQHSIWQALVSRQRDGRLPHALLLSGQQGLGKQAFAQNFAQSLLCQTPLDDGAACGKCKGCQLFQAGSHPDYAVIKPLEEGKAIGIDQIREACRYLALTSQYGGYKAVIITPADRMTTAAANSLLKTLEEPVGHTLLMLVTNRPNALLPTIRSRCQHLKYRRPPATKVLPWLHKQIGSNQDAELLLALAQGSPLTAANMAREDMLSSRRALLDDLQKIVEGKADPVVTADNWTKSGTNQVLFWMTAWVADMIRLKFTVQATLLTNRDILQELQSLAERVELQRLYNYWDEITRSSRLLEGQVNLQLLMEEVFIGWTGLFTQTPSGQKLALLEDKQ
jgi:DNA polymerase-3 subunit delta'